VTSTHALCTAAPVGGTTAGLMLIGMSATELAVASLAEAMDLPRHHLLFYALVDMLLMAGLWLTALTPLHHRTPAPDGE